MKRRLLGLATIAIAHAALLGPAAAQDVIKKKDGTTLPPPGGREIRVTKETLTEIRYMMEGISAEQALPTKDVASIAYARMPDAYRAGLESVEAGDHEQAAAAFQQALDTRGAPHWVKQNALFRLGSSLSRIGRAEDAVKAFTQLLKEAPDTRFFAEAWVGLIQGALARGQEGIGAAKKAVNDFERAIKQKGLGKRWEFEAAYWDLRIADLEGKDITAAAERLSREAERDNAEVANKAKVLIGFNLVKQKPADAKGYFEQVLAAAGEQQHGVKAAAYAGLGLAVYKTTAERDLDGYRRALQLFLRAVTLGDQHTEAVNDDVTVRSLFYAGKCFTLLRKDNPNYVKYARRLYRDVVKQFPNDALRKDAEAELKK